MKLLCIRIPIAPPHAVIEPQHDRSLMDAAFEELCTLIPALSHLQNSMTRLGITGEGNQVFLCATMVPTRQLVLKLTPAHRAAGRVIELDPSLLDQSAVRKSFQLTLDLIAAAGDGDPDALREWAQKYERAKNLRDASRLRRALGERYEITVFGEPEIVSLPGLEAARVEDRIRRLSVVVKTMKESRSFTAAGISEISDEDGEELTFEPRQRWVFVRRSRSQTLDSGRRLHDAMAMRLPIVVNCRLVRQIAQGLGIAFEVESLADPL